MPDNTTPEREQLLRLYGAEIVHSPGAEGSNGAIRLAQRLADEDPSLFMPYQYGNEANPRAHEATTGPEILAPGARTSTSSSPGWGPAARSPGSVAT